MKIGIIGTGLVAATLAEHWTAAGHTVTLGSRAPATATVRYPVASVAHVVRGNQVLVNATPGAVSLEALGAVAPEAYDGKIVIDVANAVSRSFDLQYPDGSLGERLQAALPGAKLVKTLNTASMTVLTAPASMEPASVFLSGDDGAAKATVTGLLRDLGWNDDSITDLGGLQTARATEHFFLLFAALMRATDRPFNIRVVTG